METAKKMKYQEESSPFLKELLIDIYSEIREIYHMLDQISESTPEVLFIKARLPQIEEEIFALNKINNKTKEQKAMYPKYYIELQNMKSELKDSKSQSPNIDFSQNRELEDKYYETIRHIERNNLSVNDKANIMLDNRPEKNSLFQILKPSSYEFMILTLIISNIVGSYAPIFKTEKQTYSSKTNEKTIEEDFTYHLKSFQIIKLFDEFASSNKAILEERSSGSTFEEAISRAEELLKKYENENPSSEYDNPNNNQYYYEVIYLNEHDNFGGGIGFKLMVTLCLMIGIFFAANGFTDLYDELLMTEEEEPDKTSGALLIKRIIENLRANFISKKDLKKLIEYSKEIQEKNGELANELYSLVIEGENFKDFDLLYEQIEALVKKPEQIVAEKSM